MSNSNAETQGVAGAVLATAIAGTVLIALGGYWLSFARLTAFAGFAAIPTSQAWVWPLIVDGINVIATVSVAALGRYRIRVRVYPTGLLLCSAALSVTANATGAILDDRNGLPVLAAAVASVAPLSSLAVTQLTVQLLRSRHLRPAPGADARADARERARQLRQQQVPDAAIARDLGVHRSTVGRWLRQELDPSTEMERRTP